jgi:beta-xylosidase
MNLFYSLYALLPVAQLVSAQIRANNSSDTYTNPVLDTVGADPWVVRYDDWYYMTVGGPFQTTC